jgi:hypothetical protein
MGQRRLRVKVPQLFNSEVTDWAWPREDASTKVQAPAIGQGVWVMFEGGDPAFPLWVGTFGRQQGGGHHGLVAPYSGSTSGMTMHSFGDGTSAVDILATIAALQARIVALENKPDPDA